jgi:hypothetical protein
MRASAHFQIQAAAACTLERAAAATDGAADSSRARPLTIASIIAAALRDAVPAGKWTLDRKSVV